MNAPVTADRSVRTGLILGLLAYAIWGVLPIYFKAIAEVSAFDIVAHRIVWSLLFLAILLTLLKSWGEIAVAVRRGATVGLLVVTAILIAANWLIYVYAINSGHILAGSLGYYLNPLANILLGRFVLKERLGALQWTAVAVAAVGIAVLAAGAGATLWISLSLCLSFALYGLLRKIAQVDAVAGLTIETALLLPAAIAWLVFGHFAGRTVLGDDTSQTALLVFAGIASTAPLLMFTAAARRLRYSTLGMLQFIAPTLQFLLAVWLYGEPFTRAHAIAFACIWTALALYVAALVRDLRAARTAAPCAELSEP